MMVLNFYVLTRILLSITGREEHNALEDKTQWPNNRNYKYSWRTATSGLRSHLERFHKEEYIRLSKERGWVIQLASLKSQQGKSTGANNLPPQILFSSDAVTDHLVRFITANDQVRLGLTLLELEFFDSIIINLSIQSINVVENRQFRELLTLFRNDYSDDDMPHRTRIRQAIMETWQKSFKQLKSDLAVWLLVNSLNFYSSFIF
jgi:hypothetical protein